MHVEAHQLIEETKLVINGIEIHPAKRIGFSVGPGSTEFVTESPCMKNESVEIHLGSRAAVVSVEAGETVFLTGALPGSMLSVFISEEEFEEDLLYPNE